MIENLKNAILNNDKDLFKSIIYTCTINELNSIDTQGNTLLHLAVSSGSLYFVKQLLKRGADISQQNDEGNTSLHLAIKHGYFNIVDEMLGVSETAQNRKKKETWLDKNRAHKLKLLEISQNKAKSLLNVPNKQNEIPLLIAAQLHEDLIYKNLLLPELTPGYSKSDIDQALFLRLKQVDSTHINYFNTSFLEILCPIASIAELPESFAFAGLLTGASATMILCLNTTLSAISILGFSMILYVNYLKATLEKDIMRELETLQSNLAFLQGVRKRIELFESKQSLSAAEKHELECIKKSLLITHPKNSLKGHEESAADFVTKQDKFLAAFSSVGSFLCVYSGALGLLGLGVGVTAQIMGLSATLLIISSGPIGIGIALGIGLVVAGLIALHHYNTRKQEYITFGEKRYSINKLQSAIYREQKDLKNGSDNVLNKVESLLTKESLSNQSIFVKQNKDLKSQIEVTNARTLNLNGIK